MSAQTTGTIAGTVTATAGGAPILSATVQVFDSARTQLNSATTDNTGAYSVAMLPAGTYYIHVSATGFVPQAYSGIPCAAISCYTLNVALGVTPTPVSVTPGGTTTVNVSLDQGATISGTVRLASDNTPISGVTMQLYDSSTSRIPSIVSTQSDGTYSFTGVPFGTYYARTQRNTTESPLPDYLDTLFGGALCPGQASAAPRCRVDSGTPVVVSSGSPAATADFSLPAGGHISGRVTSASSGSGIANLTVEAFAGSTQIAMATTDSSGNYSIVGLDPGTYSVRTLAGTIVAIPSTSARFVDQWYPAICAACAGAKPQGVAVTAAAATSGINFNLPVTTGAISGTVTFPNETGAAFEMPEIQIYSSDGVLVNTVALGIRLNTTTTSVTNAWSLGGLPDGTYYARTTTADVAPFLGTSGGYWVDQLYSGKVCVAADCLPTSGTPIVVSNGSSVGNVSFTLDLGGKILGGLPGGNLQSMVDIFDSRGVLLPGAGRIFEVHGGIYAFFYGSIGLPAGTYYVLLDNSSAGGSNVLYRDLPCVGCAVTNGTPITLTAGGVYPDADGGLLTSSSQTLSGIVQSDSTAVPANQPLSTITVELYAANGHLQRSGLTFADGTYRIFHVDAGTYYVRTRNTRGFIDQVYGGATCGACNPLSGTPVVVTSGTDVSGIDFALPQGQTVSGQVLAFGGGPLASTGILLYASSPSTPAAHVTTDAFGVYSATVPSGSYYVQTDPVAGYAQQIYNGIACPQGTCPTAAATSVTVTSSAVTGVNFNLPACTSGSIAPVSLALGAVGAPYRQTLLVTGAIGVRFSVSSGTLPPGLTLDPSSGVMAGAPTLSGHFTFTVSVVDASGCVSSRTYTLDVPPCAFTLDVPPSSLAFPYAGATISFAVVNACGSFTATSNVPWMSVVAAGTSVDLTVAANTGPARQGTVTVGPRAIPVVQGGSMGSAIFGSFDAPADGTVVSGSVALTGWALADSGVTRVQVFRYPVLGENPQLVFVGNATIVPGARPDVQAAFPSLPFNDRGGWGYLLLTNMLPNHGNGTFRFYVFAVDANLTSTLLGTKTITAANRSATAPFGAIDTPDQGATASGSAFVNFGWALTPQPKMIPIDGSTIQVIIDGVPVGTPTAYNLFRPDVSTLFPGLKNSGGPVGYRVIDTTALSEGLHTIAWVATDDGGVATGIGSRFFTVSNSAWQPSLRANFLTPSASSSTTPPAVTDTELAHADATTAIPPRVDGVDLSREVESLASLPIDPNGARTVTMSNLQVLQLSLTAGSQDVAGQGVSCAATYAGYLVVKGTLRALPVGSSLDPAGTFYWHPGAAFFGTYQLLFVRTSCDGTQQRIPVIIRVE